MKEGGNLLAQEGSFIGIPFSCGGLYCVVLLLRADRICHSPSLSYLLLWAYHTQNQQSAR